MNTSTVANARFALQEAQESLRQAEAAEALQLSFGDTQDVFVVMARRPTFGQFVSYSEEGILMAIFSDENEAARFARETKAPASTMLQVEPFEAHIR